MSLHSLSKDMLIQIICKIERPKYISKVRGRNQNKYEDCDKFIGPFYTMEEIQEYFKLNSSDFLHFKKHRHLYRGEFIYELVVLNSLK